MGLLGQEHLPGENRIWITKTHFPYNHETEPAFQAQKMFCVVRNPLEIIPSIAYLLHTWGHSLVTNEKLHQEFPEWWNNWVKDFATRIKWNNDFILN